VLLLVFVNGVTQTERKRLEVYFLFLATPANRRQGGNTRFRAARSFKHEVSGGGSLDFRLPRAKVLIKGRGLRKHATLTLGNNGKNTILVER
jgi:hypothetical protein